MGRLDEACAELEQAVVLAPDYVDAIYNLAKLYRDLGDWDSALGAYARVIALDPKHLDARINRANLLAEDGRIEEACAGYKDAAAVADDIGGQVRAHVFRGNALRRAGRDEEAMAAYDAALALEPHDGLAIKRALTVPIVTQSRAHIDAVRARVDTEIDALMARDLDVLDPGLETSTTNFYLAYHALGDRALQEKTAALQLKACPDLAWVARHCRNWSLPKGRRIRLGIASAYFRRHSIGRLNVGLIAGLDKERFEIFVFSTSDVDDAISREIKESADHVTVMTRDLEAARRTIAEAELDILYYPEIGMDVLTYFYAYARLAPVQCVGWGHPDTTGIPNMDYFVSSDLLEREGAEADYSEKLRCLSTLPTCYRRPEIPARLKSRQELGLPEDRHLYLCPQSIFKLHPDTDLLFRDILAGDPAGEIVLIEGTVAPLTDQLRARLARAIPEFQSRVRFVPRLSPEDFLALIAASDVVLDAPHFSGGNTSYEAFALGKPIVTHDGAFMRGRVTAGMYRKMGLDDSIAESFEDYAAFALKLGTDEAFRAEIEARVAANVDALFEDTEAVREWERFFESALDEA